MPMLMNPYLKDKLMANKKNKIQGKTNLDNATPEQQERLMKNVAEAYQTLCRSVLERKIREMVRLP